MIGPRGSGKTTVLSNVLQDVQKEAMQEYTIVQLNGNSNITCIIFIIIIIIDKKNNRTSAPQPRLDLDHLAGGRNTFQSFLA